MAETSGDSQSGYEGYAFCHNCEKDFPVDIYVTYSGASGNIHDLPEEYDVVIEEIDRIDEEEEDFFWEVTSTEQFKVFQDHIKSVNEILDHEFDEQTQFSVLVMLYAHIVASTELFLSSVFISEVTNSDELTKRLIESDPEFGKRKFTLTEIYQQQKILKATVALYLKDLIFHDLKKIKPMYNSVLGLDFGDISWLFAAVLKRHDCAHRAGYDKEWNKIVITVVEIKEVMKKCSELAEKIDLHITNRYI